MKFDSLFIIRTITLSIIYYLCFFVYLGFTSLLAAIQYNSKESNLELLQHGAEVNSKADIG